MSDKTAIRSVEVYTADRYLFQKIRLAMPDGVSVTAGKGDAVFPIRLVDVDTVSLLPDGEFMSMSRSRSSADIKIPFPIEAIAQLISENGKVEPDITLSDEERSVYLHGEKIKLTEVEYQLMSALYLASGEYVGREELLQRVWGGDADPGVLNVYIHYLREKLEGGGEKIILSSRKCGYKISERYIERGGDGNAQNN